MYDRITQRRFDKNHPVWQARMLTKAGKPYQRWDAAKAAELEALAVVLLVPAVTEIAAVADGFGVFGVASDWGMKIGVDAAIAVVPPIPIPASMQAWQLAARERAQEIMDGPKNKGSELHECFHLIRTGEIEYGKATDDQKAFYDGCQAMLKRLNVEIEGTEVEFAEEGFGGTCDLDGNCVGIAVGIDWKTVSKPREPRKKELLQIGAYGMHFGWDHAWICYWLQDERRFLPPFVMDECAITAAYQAFARALDLYSMLNDLDAVLSSSKQVHSRA